MANRIVILGGGTGGTLMANRLHRRYGKEAVITVVDRDDRHVYQPDLLFLPFGMVKHNTFCRPRDDYLHSGVDFRIGEVDRVETVENVVHLTNGVSLPYDVLITATGASLLLDETEGLTGPGWQRNIFTYYSPETAVALRDGLRRFEGGRLVVDLIDLPIKCPVAPLEFCFLAEWWLRKRGLRDKVELTFVTPLDGAFTKPVASRLLDGMLAERGIALETEFATGRIDGEAGSVHSWDEREVPFDLLVAIPLHGGPAYVERSPGLGDELGFIPCDPRTLQAKAAENVFVIGDGSNVPTSKAGSVAHFQSDTLMENIERHFEGKALVGSFDGHANCFIETGYGKAILLDFNYDVEPLPGRFPFGRLGPFRLLGDSRLNHLGKLLFRWIYWHMLLRGRDLPFITPQLKLKGKRQSVPAPAAEGGPS
ncbi:MAG: type III sulfide quinone reductase, selenoprotein subtype [Gaiellaceae bacterium]